MEWPWATMSPGRGSTTVQEQTLEIPRRTRRPCPTPLRSPEPVVLGDPLAAAGRAGLDLPAAHGHGEVGQEGVLGFAGAVRDDVAPAGLLAHLDRLDGLGHRADLIELDEHGVGGLLLDAAGDELGVGHVEVVADDLDLVAQGGRVLAEAVPVVFRQAVLDGDDGYFSPRSCRGPSSGRWSSCPGPTWPGCRPRPRRRSWPPGPMRWRCPCPGT
jgi:hypothetical protein